MNYCIEDCETQKEEVATNHNCDFLLFRVKELKEELRVASEAAQYYYSKIKMDLRGFGSEMPETWQEHQKNSERLKCKNIAKLTA